MCSKPSGPDDAAPWVRIIEESEDYRLNDLFRVTRATLQYRRFDGRMSDLIARMNFERGDSVGVLLYDPQDDSVILVRQFRYPVFAGLSPDEREGDGAKQAWLLEIVAGVKDVGRTVEEVAHKEVLEEAGYQIVGELQPITTIYPSPGGTSERIHLFLGEVDRWQRAGNGEGVVAEGEDTQILVLPLPDAMRRIASGRIRDAKTIIALQHLWLLRIKQAEPGSSS